MLGAIIGDICGSVYEFRNCKDYNKIELFAESCRFTDDSVMTVAVGQTLMDMCGAENDGRTLADWKELLVKNMKYYGRLYPHAGYGGTFSGWLRMQNPEPYNSWGNGSAMRASAAGWLAKSLPEALELAEFTASVTHNHPEGIKGAQAIAGAVYLAKNGADKEQIRAFAESLGYVFDFTCDSLRPGYEFDVSCQGSVPQALEVFFESRNFENCIRLAISLGGDSDTIADMAGAVGEAFYGIPAWMKEKAYEVLPDSLVTQVRRFEKYQNGEIQNL